MKFDFNLSILFCLSILLISCVVFTKKQTKIWKRHIIDNSFSGADGVRLADVNDDQLLDIATGWEEGGYTTVYLHPGYAKAKQKWPSIVVGKTPSIEDAVFADLNQDNAIDVVSSTEGKDQKIYINWAPTNPDFYQDSSKWTTEILPASTNRTKWMFAVPAQIDGVHGVDLIAGAKGENAQIAWFQAPKNAQNIADWNYYPISSAKWIMSLILRDIDQDGDMDIITSDRKPSATNAVRWLENPGELKQQKRAWKNHFIGGKGLELMFMDVADLDEDGLEDVIATEYTNQNIIFMKKLDQTGRHWKSYNIAIPSICGRAKAVKVGDINGDGKLDLVLSSNTLKNNQKVGLIWMSYKNAVTDAIWDWHPLSGPVGIKFDRLELLDIDGDKDLDVLTCEENYGEQSQGLGVLWYENPFY